MLLTITQAIVLFAATNIDHLLVLTLLFAHGAHRAHTFRQIMLGQYIGFGAMLGVITLAAFGIIRLLPPWIAPWFGLIPLFIGVRAAWKTWRSSGEDDDDELGEVAERIEGKPLSVALIAAITFANGGDEIGVYLPVFVQAEPWQIAVYLIVFLLLVTPVVHLARFITSRKPIAEALERWETVLFPAVLIALGIIILATGLIG
ncbi:MAG: cadmium resistance transporter [Actinomycetaceae bacterium]|nr:cadmium resistance transporter [Arcanobacterium sp.]MDD7505515.1 cadmium resistance transporter [Actinomycetaceae bacterium]